MGPNEETNTGIENSDRPESPSISRRRRRGGRGRRGGTRRGSRLEEQPELAGLSPSLEELAEAQAFGQEHPLEGEPLSNEEESLPEAQGLELREEARTEVVPHWEEEAEAPPRAPSAPASQSARRHIAPPAQEARPRRPASASSVKEAIEEVNQVIDALKGALEEMEEVLETLELAERQKDADEQEIESLRRGLRQLHRSREPGRGR